MDKTIGYEVIVDPVNGFHDAKAWIYRMIRAGIVKCGQCDQPATSVFWQDQAEWYCRCQDHQEYGEMWTGSTRWNPTSFSLNVIQSAALEWLETLEDDERERIRIESFDSTDYWDLINDDIKSTRHYFKGNQDEDGFKVYAKIYPLKNGEYAYSISRESFFSCYTDAIQGAWKTEQEAIEAARIEVGENDR